MEKTIKYLENGEYHYATVRSVGDLAQLKTTSKETLVEAINELWNGGGNADPSKAPKPEGYDQLVQDVADAVKNQQEISQQWIEWQNEEAQLTEERKQAYLQAMKEMQEAVDKAKADAAALDDKTDRLDEQITKAFSDLDTTIQNMHEQLQKEADRMNKDLQDTKGTLSTLRTDLQNAQMDNGKIHDELTNINGKFEHKVWQTDLDPLKEQIDRTETSVQQTKDELLGKASRQDLDTVSNTVSKLDTQLKETAKGVEISVKKDELGGEIAEALTNKTNILLGTRRFTTNNWAQRDHVEICSDPWKGFLVAKQNSPIEGIQQAYDVKAGTTYAFSLFAKMDTLDDSNKPQIILAKNNLDTSLDTKIDVWRKDIEDITSNFKRYDLTFTPSEDCTIYPHVISNSNNPIFVCGYQLEIGKTSTPWEPNQEDVGDYVEKSESQFNVYNDRIQALTEKQRQQGDTQEKLRTEVTQTAEGTKQVSENLKKANDDITKLRAEFEVRADHMKSEYETYTNKAVGQISDSTLNLIRNSSFQNKDEDFAQWQNISAKANIRQDENGLRWVELTQSGMTTNNPEGITSNYFNIKQGKVTVAVDIKSGDKASLDNNSVLSLELYNDVKKRVDFYDVSLSQLGLSKELLGDHKVHRGLYRLGIDRNDAKYMTVKAKLVKNGDLYFTNFSARLSSIDDGAYEPNPDDINQQILKQNTKIEQNSKEVAIKANSVDVTRDIKSAVDGIQVGGTNVLKNTDPDSFSTTESDHTWTVGSAGNGHGTIVDLDSNFSARHGFGIIGNTGGNKDFNQHPIHWNGGKYVFTVYIRLAPETGQTSVTALIRAWNYTKGTESYARMIAIKSREWQKLSLEIDSSSFYKDDCGFSFGVMGIGSLNFAEPMLVTGTKAMDWSPSPQDTSEEIKSAKDAAIQVASDQINIHVNELSTSFEDKLNKRVNEVKTASEKFTSDGIEQTVSKITNVKNDVDRLGDNLRNTGTRNLLHNTSDQYRTLTGNGWFAKSTAKDIYTSVANYHNGNQFTYAATITNPSNYPVRLVIYCYDKSKDKKLKTILGSTVSANQPNARVDVTTVMDTNTWWIRTNIETLQGNTPQISIQVKDERLVEGTAPSSWSPNPDDINQQITNTNKKIDTQVLDSANIDQMKTQGHYFVHNLMGNPIGGWVYVDVMGNGNDRIRQDVYQDSGNRHMYRRLFGNSWSGWEQGAYISDVNNVKTEVTASVKNLGDRVTTEVNSVETRVNNKIGEISVGGRNYISPKNINKYYADNLNYDNNSGIWTVNIPNDCGGSWGAGISFGQSSMVVPWGQAYTDSVEVYVTEPNLRWQVDINSYGIQNDSNLGGNDNDDRGRSSSIPQTGSVIPTNQWYKLSFTAWNTNGKNKNHIGLWDSSGFGIVNNTGHTITVKFRRPKQELGTKATDWSTNPDDTIEAIKEVNTKWDVANGQIQGKVTATDVNNILNGKGYATQSWAQTQFQMKSDAITLQAIRNNITNGIQNQVNDTRNQLNNMQVGGRNLLRWTSNKMVFYSGTNWVDFWTTQSKYTSVADYHNGNQFTYSAMITNNSDENVALELYNCSANYGRTGGGKLSITVPPHAQKMRVSVVITITSDTWYVEHHLVSTRNLGTKKITVGMAEEKFEPGNKATPWSPAPEDNLEGNVNLYHGTADFTGTWNERRNDGSWQKDGWLTSNGNIALKRDKAWCGVGQSIWLERGIYTFSCDAYVHSFDANDSLNLYYGDNQYGGTAATIAMENTELKSNMQNAWHTIHAIFFVLTAGNVVVRPELNRDHGVVHVGSFKLVKGSAVTSWSMNSVDNATGDKLISKINISPNQIKIASNKIIIDGNTDIHGTLRVPDVKLAGRNGNVDLSGDGINITKTNGAGINIASNGIQLTANTNGQNEIEGVITTAWSLNNKNQNGIGLVITPEQTLGKPYGGDILTIGSMPASGTIHAAMVFDATGINPDYKRGFNWFAPHTLNGDGGVLRFPGAQDDLMLYPGNMPGSRQSSYSQPTLRLVHGNSQGSAGIQFQWDDIVPFGRIETTHSYFAPVGARADSGLGVGWVHWSDWDWDGNVPMIHRRDANGGVNAGFAFFSSGDTVWWKGGYRSNLIGSLRQTDSDNAPQIGGF